MSFQWHHINQKGNITGHHKSKRNVNFLFVGKDRYDFVSGEVGNDKWKVNSNKVTLIGRSFHEIGQKCQNLSRQKCVKFSEEILANQTNPGRDKFLKVKMALPFPAVKITHGEAVPRRSLSDHRPTKCKVGDWICFANISDFPNSMQCNAEKL